MHRSLVVLVTMMLALVPMWPSSRTAAQISKQVNREVLRKQAVALSTSNYQRFVRGEGPCQTGDANPGTRTIFSAVLGCIQTPSPTIFPAFLLPVLTSGAALPDAKVVATFVVSHILGAASVIASAHIPDSTASRGGQARLVIKPGTYTVTSKPFTMEANQPYQAAVTVLFFDGCEQACAIVLRVTELKWEF